jgi:hypothetical protein
MEHSMADVDFNPSVTRSNVVEVTVVLWICRAFIARLTISPLQMSRTS